MSRRDEIHLPWDAEDLRYYRTERGYRGVTTCGRSVPAESMGSFDGKHRVTCAECKEFDTAAYSARRNVLLCDFERRCVMALARKRGLPITRVRRAALRTADLDALRTVYGYLRNGRWPVEEGGACLDSAGK